LGIKFTKKERKKKQRNKETNKQNENMINNGYSCGFNLQVIALLLFFSPLPKFKPTFLTLHIIIRQQFSLIKSLRTSPERGPTDKQSKKDGWRNERKIKEEKK
jgi:hypothetical protein